MAIFIALSVSACVDLLGERLPLPQRFYPKAVLTGVFIVALVAVGFDDYFVRVPAKFLPDPQNIMDFYNLELPEPRDVLYISSLPQDAPDYVPALTRLLRTQATFQTVRPDDMDRYIQPGERYTTFFPPEDAQAVVQHLSEKLDRDDIIPKVYYNTDGRIILMSYEFQM